MEFSNQLEEARSQCNILEEESKAIRQRLMDIHNESVKLEERSRELVGYFGSGLIGQIQRHIQKLERLEEDSRLAHFQVTQNLNVHTLVITSCGRQYLYCRVKGDRMTLRLDLQTFYLDGINVALSPSEIVSLQEAIKKHRQKNKRHVSASC